MPPCQCHPDGVICNHSSHNGGCDQTEKKKRRPKPNQKMKISDGKTLRQREKEAKDILMSLRVDYDALDMTSALAMHQQEQCTAEQRLALRATIAEKMINAETEEGKALQFELFVQEMARSLQDVDNPTKAWLRASFLKAAHHRMHPEKHAAKHMQK